MTLALDRIAGIPPLIAIASTESLPIAFDFGANLDPGEMLSDPVVTLVNIDTAAEFPDGLNGTPAIDGPLVIQIIGPGLQPGNEYESRVSATTTNGRRWTIVTKHPCPV